MLHCVSHKFCRAKAVCHCLQCPCHCQDQDSRNHRLKSFRKTWHAICEVQYASYQIEHNGNDQCEEASYRKSYGCITVRKCSDKIVTLEESAGPDHSNDTADDQHYDRKDQINNSSFLIHDFFGSILIWSVRSCINIPILNCIIFMDFHRTILYFEEYQTKHHNNGK